jgi:hypothetical protein
VATTIPDCRKAATVVRTMLKRIETQLGISPATVDSPDDSVRTGSGSTSSYDEQKSSLTETTANSVATYSSYEGHNNGDGSNNDMGPPLEAFVDFGMVDVSLGAMDDPIDAGLQQQVNMTDPWDISQAQNGYDWVSRPLCLSPVTLCVFMNLGSCPQPPYAALIFCVIFVPVSLTALPRINLML